MMMKMNEIWFGAINRFTYKNYKDEVSERRVIPLFLIHTDNEYHREGPQWFLRCWDLDRQAHRDFALDDIIIQKPIIHEYA